MKYILMMNTMRAGGHGLADWAKKDMQAHIAFMINLNKELRESDCLGRWTPIRELPGIIAWTPFAPTCWKWPATNRPQLHTTGWPRAVRRACRNGIIWLRRRRGSARASQAWTGRCRAPIHKKVKGRQKRSFRGGSGVPACRFDNAETPHPFVASILPLSGER